MKAELRRLAGHLAVAMVTLALSAVVFAQESNPGAQKENQGTSPEVQATNPETQGEKESSSPEAQVTVPVALGEIVVTAQKRTQSAQDVPLAIASFSGDELREQRIENAVDLAEIIPNVSIQNRSGGGMPVVIMRGIGLQNFRINDSPTTSFYVDEVYQTSIASAEFSMFDLERVEVLKGPQGGLYGRNTIGGAVQVISKRPNLGGLSEGYATLGYGRYSRLEGETGLTIPLGTTAAARVAARFVQSGDTYYRSTTDGFDYGEQDKWAFRTIISAAPSENVTLDFKLHAGSDKSDLPLLRTIGIYKNIGNAGDYGAPGVSLGLLAGLLGLPGGGLCDSILAGNGSDPNTCATLTGVTPNDYGLYAGSGARYDSAVGRSFLPSLDTQWQGASMIASFYFGDYSLVSISAYDHIDYGRHNDADATLLEHQNIDYGTDISSWQQEFRLSNNDNGQWKWLIGINYAEDTLDESTALYGADGVLPLFFGGATWSYQDYTQKTETLAVYGHVERHLSDAWNVVGELRYTNADKTFVGEQRLGFPDESTAPFLSADDTKSFSDYSGKIGLEWSLSDNAMLYGSISRGFKTGGFFGGFATSPEQLEPFDEETILAYELGLKSEWLDRRLRLNGSVFYYVREDVQMNAAKGGETISIARLQNIGDVDAQGAEIDLSWLATPNLTLNLGLGYLDSEIVRSDFVFRSVLPLIGTAPLEGVNTPNYSKYSANFIGRYEGPIGAKLTGGIQLEYSYRSKRDLSLITQPQYEEPLFQEPQHSLVNLRLTLGPRNRAWQVIAFVENLTDEVYRVEATGDGLYGVRELYGPPRRWGASLAYRW